MNPRHHPIDRKMETLYDSKFLLISSQETIARILVVRHKVKAVYSIKWSSKHSRMDFQFIFNTNFVNAAQALNSILQQWGKPANTQQWNTTGDPCSGLAIVDTASIDNPQYNPFIKCDCSYDGNTTCHITAL